MENGGDILHCEERLKNTLHCDDKEKLRRKLALLKREYLRTAQRLQRAERSEAVRRHVRSRITQQTYQDQRDPEVSSNPCINPSSLTLDTQNGTASGVPQRQGQTTGPTDSENSRRIQGIRFLLPSDAACPQTPDPSRDTARGDRPTSALRLRSRRSRLRWERRSAEAGRSTDNREKGQEQSERMETEGEEARVQTEVVNESEELFSGTESESPSLLLTHWNTCGQAETGNMEEKEVEGGQEQREKETELRAEGEKESESTSLLLTCCNPAIHADRRGQDGAQHGGRKEIDGGEEGENSRGERDGRLCEDGSIKDAERDAAEQIESEKRPHNTAEIKEDKSEMVGGEHDVKGAGVLDSCTLVDGLLFPAEYYVRTTRRMTSSQSQPDMQAVILSQLSVGRYRRARGRGRGQNRHTHSHADFSSPVAASPSAGPRRESQAPQTSAELNSQSSSEISGQISVCQIDTDACFSPTVTPARPARAKRRRRGRGRGRPQTPRCSLSSDTHQLDLVQTSDDPQLASSPASLSPSLRGADGPKPCLTQGEAVPVPDNPQPASAHSTASQPSSAAQAGSTSGHQVYPIFLKSSGQTNRTTQMSRGAAGWRSLLLPSSPPAQTSLLPLPSLPPGPLVNNLISFDIPQDFHLPDDQFASLKLHKLRQVCLESGVEHFTSPSYSTRRSIRRSDACHSSDDTVTSFPLSLTPTISNSPRPTEAEQAATQSADLQSSSVEQELRGELRTQPLTDQDVAPGEQQAEECQPHTTSLQSVCPANCVDQCEEKETDQSVQPQPHISSADKPAGRGNDDTVGLSYEREVKESSVVSSEEQTDCPGVLHPLEDQMSPNHQTEDKAIVKTLSCDCPLQETPEEPSNSCTAAQTCSDSEAEESPVQLMNVKSAAEESEASSEPTTGPPTQTQHQDKCLPRHSVHSQLLLSPRLASAPFISPHLRSSALPSSPALPSLGLTPHPVLAAVPLTSSPSAPALTLPPPHSPSTQALSPPALSPCPSLTSLPPSQPPSSPAGQIQVSSEPSQRAEPATCPTVSRMDSQDSGGLVGLRAEETAEEHMMRCTHTLKAPAGGCLVDACCLSGSSGVLCVAAAGKWAVCLWSQTAASDWSLTHTWAFNEPVINVFPVPDAAGLMCVTLGQLEIREVRMLSCSSLSQVLLCEGLVQAAVGVSKSRVVTSSHSAPGSALQVFALSDGGSTLSSQPLASPGVCVGALAPVDGLPDALIGTDEGGRLFIWNLKTGQLLQRVLLRDDLSHTACLRGFSYCGVLFVLLQHQLLSSLEEEERQARVKDQVLEEEEEKKKTALFSLVAVNPLSGKSFLATRLYPPKAWSSRLCEADVDGCSVVGLSQSGCVCVWELGRRGSSSTVWAPESEGWQLARWGGGGALLTGHHNGDVTLHCYRQRCAADS
ncbi:partner and localizer of BRCA2 [Chaetodon trifascialis]|uniref:partner and localizer of BRCA2 n=1 Tax=Chaetodon trifascialis TaxID=109706 RepID=UPI003990E7B3